MTRPCARRNGAPIDGRDAVALLDRIDPNCISLGLDNVNRVRAALGCDPLFPIITVGGTNGKGSTCAILEAILSAAGYRVGCYTSPHLLSVHERIRVSGAPVGDAALARALALVEHARAGRPLTYFEFGTLAAMRVFMDADVDVAILEVGLGGRLDAVNAFDADCAIITSIALDHTEWLGPTREAIAFEKSGIFRRGRPAICAEPDAPQTLARQARRIGAKLVEVGRDYRVETRADEWHFVGHNGFSLALPYPALRGAHQVNNASAAIAALAELAHVLPVPATHVRAGLRTAQPAGRFQRLPGTPAVYLDVAHNPHAAASLALNLAATPGPGRTLAVCAMLKDKDITGVIAEVSPQVDAWFIAGIDGPRGASACELAQALMHANVEKPHTVYSDIVTAYAHARRAARHADRIVVFGSFRTVAAVLASQSVGEPAEEAAACLP